eukprot:TRINITY_DN16066_c0_g1_i1.p1 TRINITY_DN16066_c0_g1~~TRINITY_DN16066_c0_g1_i1.p1  ORF type:complete len:130 (-),score=39.21 TRINITY_DN16066_c0_g1_i1:44-433(-)
MARKGKKKVDREVVQEFQWEAESDNDNDSNDVTSEPEEKDWAVNFIEGIFTSGIQPQIVQALDVSLVFLLLIVGLLMFLGLGNIHLYILSTLACGLFMSMKWFLSEYSIEKERLDEEEKDNAGKGTKKE